MVNRIGTWLVLALAVLALGAFLLPRGALATGTTRGGVVGRFQIVNPTPTYRGSTMLLDHNRRDVARLWRGVRGR
jgi:hypothetical protein